MNVKDSKGNFAHMYSLSILVRLFRWVIGDKIRNQNLCFTYKFIDKMHLTLYLSFQGIQILGFPVGNEKNVNILEEEDLFRLFQSHTFLRLG